MKNLVAIGEFQMGKFAVVTDPCYELGDEGTYVLNNLKDGGEWRGYVSYDDDGRVSALGAVHADVPVKNLSESLFRKLGVGLWVDSGQMAICNLKDYKHSDDEYDKYCRATSSQLRAGVVGEYNSPAPYDTKDFSLKHSYAIVSQSGWGDGTYSLYTVSNPSGEVIGIMVRF